MHEKAAATFVATARVGDVTVPARGASDRARRSRVSWEIAPPDVRAGYLLKAYRAQVLKVGLLGRSSYKVPIIAQVSTGVCSTLDGLWARALRSFQSGAMG